MVAPGGRIVWTFYQKSWKSLMLPKYWLRPITKNMCQGTTLCQVEIACSEVAPISVALGRVPKVGAGLRRLIPVANYSGILPLNEKQHLEWSLLDTFDWFSPEFDNPQTPRAVKCWLEAAGLEDIEIFKAEHLVARGRVSSGRGETITSASA
jgi:hypothetical protein